MSVESQLFSRAERLALVTSYGHIEFDLCVQESHRITLTDLYPRLQFFFRPKQQLVTSTEVCLYLL